MADRAMSTATRVVVYTIAGCVVWLLVLWLAWASQPLSDSVIVGVDGDGQPVYDDVECSTLFDSNPLPTSTALEIADNEGLVAQEPCESVHRQAQVLAAANVTLVIVVIAGVLLVAATRRPTSPDASTVDSVE
ncbi:MAG: hypothetical protein AAFY28_00350 [Actinomycetota bacterium]